MVYIIVSRLTFLVFRPVPAPKETVMTTKKTTTTTVTTKTPLKTPLAKPSTNANNSEKPSVRPPSISTTKIVEKKSSDTSNTSVTPKVSTEPPPVKPPPVSLGKIPKLNPANKSKPPEKVTPTKSVTEQKPDLLVLTNANTNNRELNPLKRRSPPPLTQSNRPPTHNPAENSDRFPPTSPADLLDSMSSTSGKLPSAQYPSLLENNSRLYTSFSRPNTSGLENTQSQSPLSPVRIVHRETRLLYR